MVEHHDGPAGVWLTLAKKGTSDPTSLRYGDALEEALCFGWIDGLAHRVDDAAYRQRFTPRPDCGSAVSVSGINARYI